MAADAILPAFERSTMHISCQEASLPQENACANKTSSCIGSNLQTHLESIYADAC